MSARSAARPAAATALQRYDRRTDQIRLITTWPEAMRGYGASEHKHRFAWTYPIVISPHDPNTLYVGGNRVFKSTNEGQSWEPISPDLTRADPETLKPTGGPVNRDAIGAETYATVFAFAESPHEAGRALGRLGRWPAPSQPRRRRRPGRRSRPPDLPRVDA